MMENKLLQKHLSRLKEKENEATKNLILIFTAMFYALSLGGKNVQFSFVYV